MRCAENMAGKKHTSETQNTPSRMTRSCASFFRLFLVFFLGELERTIRAQHLSPPGKTCRWWPSSPVFRLQFRHWASWFSQPGQPRSTPWIESLQHTHQFLGSVPGRLRRKPCRPRSDPILQGWHIGPLNECQLTWTSKTHLLVYV